MRRAFVSHSSADDSFVAELESFLRAAGFDEVFNDVHAIKPDERFWPKIEEGIQQSDALVVVITTASNSSVWVKREVELARSLSKQIIPVWIEDCSIPSVFEGRDVIDFRPRIRKERRFDISRILKYAPAELIGREEETKLLSEAWQQTLRLEKPRPHVLTFVALGGEGKTSLIAKWTADLAAQDWPGCDTAFAWSFYSQGSSETQASSSDLFLKEALNFFAVGDSKEEEIRAFAASPAGAYEKGQRLARLVGQRRSLLILDGLEPLQYAPSAPTPGELKDQGISALLKGLAQNSHVLCLVTTRYSVPDLKAFWKTTAPEVKLLRLSREAGVHLLKTLGVKGTAQEFEKLVEDVKGHALTLTLMGSYLRDAHGGDIRKRDLVKLEEADTEEQGGHAFRVMEGYEYALDQDGDKGQRALAILRLLGLFDRPMTVDCFDALLKLPTISGLTTLFFEQEKRLFGLKVNYRPIDSAQLNIAIKRLEDARLITVNRNTTDELLSLDAHPLMREYFAKWLRKQWPDAWRSAHRRLYEHLCITTKEGNSPTLDDLQPLYEAVTHGCQAGLYEKTLRQLYRVRISRGKANYSTTQLGAFGSDLGAIVCFFDTPWSRVTSTLSEELHGWLYNQAAFGLRAMGRLTEALEPMRAAIKMEVSRQHWKNAAAGATNLSELELLLGKVAESVADAEQSVTYADCSGDAWRQLSYRTTYADALHQAGRRAEARTCFYAVERMWSETNPQSPLLSSQAGVTYCDLLLAAPECAAWQVMQGLEVKRERSELIQECRSVSRRAAQTLEWAWSRRSGHLIIALDHLTRGRASLYEVTLQASALSLQSSAFEHIDTAISGLRRAGEQEFIIRGLLTSAWFRAVSKDLTGAQADLDEAWEIAERGPMRLHMADIHLYRARLFFREKPYPWESPEADLKAAEKLINECGYHRRDEELADAKRAILGQ